MEKEKLKKLKKYIKDDRPSKLKSYVKKHRICLEDIGISHGRSLLHYCCLYGSGVVLRFLLSEGVLAVEPDNRGNLPLHICLQRALDVDPVQSKEVYRELVLPLLEAAPRCLNEKNYKQVVCRDLLEQLLQRHQQEVECNVQRDWQERLAEELAEEQEQTWGRYNLEHDTWGEQNHESYDQWAERLYSDHKKKESHQTQSHKSVPKAKTRSGSSEHRKSGIIDEERLRSAREDMKRKYDYNQKQHVENRKKRRKSLYEKKFEKLLDGGTEVVLTYSDIPWPSLLSVSAMLEVMFCDVPDRSSSEFKKCLRRQQVRWHPDKFTQKFGKRLLDREKTKIMDKVKEISQALNKLSESL